MPKGGGGLSRCHVTRTEPPNAHGVTQTTWHSSEGAGGEESDQSDQAEKENQWGFPESWPTALRYCTAATVLGGILQQRRAGELPDKRTLLALAWKTSPLGSFALRLRKLGRRHTAAPEEPNGRSLKNNPKKKWTLGGAQAPAKKSSKRQRRRCPWELQNIQCQASSGSMSREWSTPRTT